MFSYFKSLNRAGQISESATTTQLSEDYIYEVQKGDSLWKIAEKEYGDGFQWKKIAQENNIENPSIIEIGTQLTLTELEEAEEQEYFVQKGDNLWKIAVAQCGDGYMWSSITRQNNLVNPSVIHVGNVMKFRCD